MSFLNNVYADTRGKLRVVNILKGRYIVVTNKKKGTIRGFHFNPEETKQLWCMRGRILVTTINMSKKSHGYLSVNRYIISGEKALLTKNHAIGYQTLENNTIVEYLIDKPYNQNKEIGIRYNDPYFNIKWRKLPLTISDKDLSYPNFKETKKCQK